jgi:UDP-2,4-diacetamido-2,4,6-trideoxy-beta-L-altropyranose hydrolase
MFGKVLFRADGGSDIGLGHLNRCLALADYLKNDFSTSFYCNTIPIESETEITINGHSFKSISSEEDFLSSVSPKDIVVLDGYQFSSEFQKSIISKGCHLVCIDDIHDRHYYADIVINYSPGISISDFDAEPSTRFLLGPDYVLLRKSFLNPPSSIDRKNECLVCVGGADTADYTYSICKTLSESYPPIKIKAIVGNSYQGKLLSYSTDQVTLLINQSSIEMASHMQNATFGVLPSSTVAFEAIASRLPFITFHYAENQKLFYEYIVKHKIALPTSIKDILTTSLLNLIKKMQIEKETLIANQSKLIDFNSPERYIQTFKNLQYEK